jgi:thiamine pyrophosphate-dependent acetolactate synthase large subunit-like protein
LGIHGDLRDFETAFCSNSRSLDLQTATNVVMTRNGAQIIWECLCHEGVTTVFGYPGGAVLPAYDAMLDYPVRHVLVRHEQGAVHMADGFARTSGHVGVTIATSGPGATNLVTGIATAIADSTPLVCITGQVSSSVLGFDAFQETDIVGVTIPVTKHSYLVTRVADIMPTLKEAFHLARTGQPGPVLVDITKDAQQAKTEWAWDSSPIKSRHVSGSAVNHRSVNEHPSGVIKNIVRLIGTSAIVISDASTRFGTVGFALPAAIGAKIAESSADIWAVTDGRGFQMMQCELTTAAQENVKINVVVINVSNALRTPDIARIAEAHGGIGLFADTVAAVEHLAHRARNADTFAVIDLCLDEEALGVAARSRDQPRR